MRKIKNFVIVTDSGKDRERKRKQFNLPLGMLDVVKDALESMEEVELLCGKERLRIIPIPCTKAALTVNHDELDLLLEGDMIFVESGGMKASFTKNHILKRYTLNLEQKSSGF